MDSLDYLIVHYFFILWTLDYLTVHYFIILWILDYLTVHYLVVGRAVYFIIIVIIFVVVDNDMIRSMAYGPLNSFKV